MNYIAATDISTATFSVTKQRYHILKGYRCFSKNIQSSFSLSLPLLSISLFSPSRTHIYTKNKQAKSQTIA